MGRSGKGTTGYGATCGATAVQAARAKMEPGLLAPPIRTKNTGISACALFLDDFFAVDNICACRQIKKG